MKQTDDLSEAVAAHCNVCAKFTGASEYHFEAENSCFKGALTAKSMHVHHPFNLDRHIKVLAGKIKIAFLSGIRQMSENDDCIVPAGHAHTIYSETPSKIQYWFTPAGN